MIVEAYDQLKAEGYLSSRAGGYTHVTEDLSPQPSGGDRKPAPIPADVRVSFGYGRADPGQFPRTAWLRSVSRVLTQAPTDRFDYTTGQGAPELRQALADYLNRVRGTAASARNMAICVGYAQGLALMMQVMAAHGVRRLAIEDPSTPRTSSPSRRRPGSR